MHDTVENRTRALRIGVAGPVGTGKSTLIATLCRQLADELQMAVVTNDIYTDEDARLLRAAGVLPVERIVAVETGACPHTAIRDDVTPNLLAVEDLERQFAPLDVVLVESGGDNLTATFSPALVDAQIFCIDVAGGGDVARKGGPGIERADLLVVNKTDLGVHVDVDPAQMVTDARAVRGGLPVVALSQRDPASIDALVRWVLSVLNAHRGGGHTPTDPGPMAPHFHFHADADADADGEHEHGEGGHGEHGHVHGEPARGVGESHDHAHAGNEHGHVHGEHARRVGEPHGEHAHAEGEQGDVRGQREHGCGEPGHAGDHGCADDTASGLHERQHAH
ncbi:urease accessory protein UreG [Nocardia camponoti]|uniref:Urease accessory protein UreG n=1 Tax=Nocardia camponoti TaxID=1616106 RepID=A0A917V4R0_9NOCA|nr:urease accessory protein UreG [Nocardia camponoti]